MIHTHWPEAATADERRCVAYSNLPHDDDAERELRRWLWSRGVNVTHEWLVGDSLVGWPHVVLRGQGLGILPGREDRDDVDAAAIARDRARWAAAHHDILRPAPETQRT